MNWVVTIYTALLFFVLTPGVLLSLPPKSGRLVVAATHAVVFALVWHFTYKMVWQFSMMGLRDGFREGISHSPSPAAKNTYSDNANSTNPM